ncbi:hypothetical protein E3O85_RS13940, partial [Enterococcus hirae]
LDGLQWATELTELDLGRTNISSHELNKLQNLQKLTSIRVAWNALDDLSALSFLWNKADCAFNAGSQNVTLPAQKLKNGNIVINVVKNPDGSLPNITPHNGGIYDKNNGTITWKNVKENTTLSYSWNGDQSGDVLKRFNGTVTFSTK